MSRGTLITDGRLMVFNTCSRFNYNVIALKSRTGVLESRRECRLKFVRRCVSSTLRHPAWEFSDFPSLLLSRATPAC